MKRQRVGLRILLASLLSLTLLVGAGVQGTALAAATLTVTPNPLTVSPGSEIFITITRTNDDGTTEIVTEGTWVIADPSIVTIEKNAQGKWVARGLAYGEVSLTFTDVFGNTVTVTLLSEEPDGQGPLEALTEYYTIVEIPVDPEVNPEGHPYGVYLPGDDAPRAFFATLAEALAYTVDEQGATRVKLLKDATETGNYLVEITFEITNGNTLTLKDGGRLSFQTSDGILSLSEGGSIIVGENGELEVCEEGQLLFLDNDTQVTVEAEGKIRVGGGGEVAGVSWQDGATIELQAGSHADLGDVGNFYDDNGDLFDFDDGVITEDTTFVWHGDGSIPGEPFNGTWEEP